MDGDFGTRTEAAGAGAALPAQLYGHVRDWPQQQVADTVRDDRDSAPYVPKGVVVGDDTGDEGGADEWRDDRRPKTPWPDSVLYELHVRGFTMRHPGIPERLRGTYAGLAHPAALEHLVRLGVTAVELLPVHQFAHEDHLVRRGCATTGATTPSATSRHTPAMPPPVPGGSRSASSSGWCGRCTTPVSR